MNTLLPKPPLIIAFGSRAKVGKDLAYRIIKQHFSNAHRFAFADALRNDLHQNLLGPQGIDVFTRDPILKERLRPLLVAYGTHLWRAIDPNHWIDRTFRLIGESNLGESDIAVITDVRYPNEVEAIKSRGGVYVDIQNPYVPFANEEEKLNSPVCLALADRVIQNPFQIEGRQEDIPGNFHRWVHAVVIEALSDREYTEGRALDTFEALEATRALVDRPIPPDALDDPSDVPTDETAPLHHA